MTLTADYRSAAHSLSVAHTYTSDLLHVVFSTKKRAPLIRNLDRLINNLHGIAHNKGIDVLAAGEPRTTYTSCCAFHQCVPSASRCAT
jgi:hypothetical protein